MITISKNNLSLEELMRLARASSQKKPEDILSAVESRVPDDKMNEVRRVLSDKKALEELLSSKQAQQLMKQFKK